MSGDFVFTVYGLILHAEEYFSINKKQKYDCRRENILYCIVNEKRKGIIDKSCVFP